MKKQLSIIAAGALLLTGCGSSAAAASTASSASTAAAADHLARIKESGKLVIGLEGDWQPFSYHDDSDQLVGFDVDVAAGIADYLGVEPSYTEEKWSGLFTGLSSGVYDIVANGVAHRNIPIRKARVAYFKARNDLAGSSHHVFSCYGAGVKVGAHNKGKFTFNDRPVHFRTNDAAAFRNLRFFKQVAIVGRIALEHFHHAFARNANLAPYHLRTVFKAQFQTFLLDGIGVRHGNDRIFFRKKGNGRIGALSFIELFGNTCLHFFA